MSDMATFTIAVPVDAISTEDWRDDSRWDDLMDFADGLFPGVVVHGWGSLERDDGDETSEQRHGTDAMGVVGGSDDE